jgi:hypothetical protein
MVGGFNTNVRHHGRILHVQTEATSRPRSQITTLLFEGGTILNAHRTDLSGEEEGPALRNRMEAQHREFIGSLKAGELDLQLGLGSPGSTSGRRDREPLRRFGDGVISSSRLDELVLAQLTSG